MLSLIKDDAIVLYNHISTEGYEESQGDILVVSGMAEDIWDALLEYQVGDRWPSATTASLTLG